MSEKYKQHEQTKRAISALIASGFKRKWFSVRTDVNYRTGDVGDAHIFVRDWEINVEEQLNMKDEILENGIDMIAWVSQKDENKIWNVTYQMSHTETGTYREITH